MSDHVEQMTDRWNEIGWNEIGWIRDFA